MEPIFRSITSSCSMLKPCPERIKTSQEAGSWVPLPRWVCGHGMLTVRMAHPVSGGFLQARATLEQRRNGDVHGISRLPQEL